ncbi:Domain of uncharacterised function (DUF386) [Raoultella terrigena]|uniref:Domain of uncharacterized function (DUF386) n=1 Tax=Raoultella terrigena TaxID=577 RepID=A0A4U9D603_RAOTE|nr:Domain of uncharacterised function (DUF386) [Raoultella terrigena]
MIIDTLAAAAKNTFYPSVIRQALQAVAQQDPHSLPPGKYTVDGDNLFFTVVEGPDAPRWRNSVRSTIVSTSIFISCWQGLRLLGREIKG